jgi:predicted short-subunit dehydrogenase-like oxidoreductase (DUF2520 family)
MKQRPVLGFIGAGRVAKVLVHEFDRIGYPVAAVASRSPSSAEAAAALVPLTRSVTAQQVADMVDVVFVTTSDSAIAEVAAAIRWRSGQAVVHCSGALTLQPLSPARDAGAIVGSWHPFQTFGGSTLLPGATFGIEADDELLGFLDRLTEEIGGFPLRVPAAARPLYHAASVMSCGYLTTLLNEARVLWERAGLAPDAAMAAIGHIASSTVANLRSTGAELSLTGPIARGDQGTVRAHLEGIRSAVPELLPLYREIGLRSIALAKAAGRPGGSVDWTDVFEESGDGG